MTESECSHCRALRDALSSEQARGDALQQKNDALEQRIADLEAERARLEVELAETVKLAELQRADLERYQKAYESVRPNHPERVPEDQLQLGFERVLALLGAEPPPANDADDDANNSGDETESAADDESSSRGSGKEGKKRKGKKRHAHGRRKLDLEGLEKKEVEIIPPEVLAAGGKGFKRIGEEVSSRVAYREAGYVHLIIRRIKFVRVDEDEELTGDDVSESTDAVIDTEGSEVSPILTAPLPDSVLPNMMADPSAIAHVIVSKYEDILPLNRQERISEREGFVLPRSTQCGWLSRAHSIVHRIVDAMFRDAKKHAFCLATDATGAPVRAPGACQSWHVFVFIADRDHVVFRYVEGHATSDGVAKLLDGFSGRLLADAAPVYDALYESGDVVEHCCWYHCRRYFYRALETDRERALEPLSLIAKLFEVDADCQGLADLDRRTTERAERSRPLLDLLDQWMDHNRDAVDPRSPLDKAIGYYDNQRDALHRFVEDARISLHNNHSEQQLRNLALGRHAWTFFANETGLSWYTTFRSLLASCRLHQLNPQTYLEEILRLTPHWPVTRVLELSPKHWATTRENLNDEQRALIKRPWETEAQSGPEPTSKPSRASPLELAG